VVGGGEIGLEKVEGLLACGGDVTVIAPEVEDALADYAAEGSIKWERRAFADADLNGRFLAIAATDDTDVNIAVYDGAERRAMLVNVVDVPPLCNFILPAIVRTGPLAIAISTAGASPGLRRRLRPPGGDPQRRPRLGEGDLAHLSGPQGVFRGDRQRRPGPDRAAARRSRHRGPRADRGGEGVSRLGADVWRLEHRTAGHLHLGGGTAAARVARGRHLEARPHPQVPPLRRQGRDRQGPLSGLRLQVRELTISG
jgi:NAD(P)-dependent dehydrogenase (short-subunit alcohol dehydrogenase family)